MARQSYQRLSPADMDEIWSRMRAGHAVKPTARSLGLASSTVRTYLMRCGGIRPDPRHRAAGRLSVEERTEKLHWVVTAQPGRLVREQGEGGSV